MKSMTGKQKKSELAFVKDPTQLYHKCCLGYVPIDISYGHEKIYKFDETLKKFVTQ